MTTVLSSHDNTDRHELKVAVLDAFALSFENVFGRQAFELVLLAPAVKKVISAEKQEEILKLSDEGAAIEDIFRVFELFDEFELAYITIAFGGGYLDKSFRSLSAHLKDYYVH